MSCDLIPPTIYGACSDRCRRGADSDRINRALQQLRSARVADFVTDEAHADLAAYELQPPNLDLWLGTTGPLSQGLHLGKTLTNNPALVFAKREGWNGVITTLNEPLSPWRGAVNDFREFPVDRSHLTGQ